MIDLIFLFTVTSNKRTDFEVIYERVLQPLDIKIAYHNGKYKRTGHGAAGWFFPLDRDIYFGLAQSRDPYR